MNKPFIGSYLYIKEIPAINGYGVYTDKDLREGEIVEISPVIIYPRKLLDAAIYMSIADGLKDNQVILDQYAIVWSNNNSAVMLGYLSIYNHSSNPPARFFTDFSNRLMGVIATRDLPKGSQVTVSYGPDWFEQKKGYITPVDF